MRKKLIMTCTALGILSLCSYTKVQANLLSYDKIELSELFNNKVDYNMLEDRESGIKVSTETKMYTTTNVNVRTKDTIKSKKITTLSRGSKVIIIDKSHKKWQKINYNGHIR